MEENMKKLLSVVLALLLVLPIFANGRSEEVKEEKKLGDENVTIRFWHSASDDAGVFLDKAVEEFNATNTYGITVEAIYQGQYSDATTLMKTVVSAENYSELPDVMQLDATGKVDYLASTKAFTIDEAASLYGDDLSDYVPVALANWEYQGVQLGLPFATSTTITFYNKDMLENAGWDRAPETFADIIALKRDMEKAGITAASYGTVPSTPTLANWLGQMGSYVVDNKNGSEGMAVKLECMENGALERFLTKWKEMYDAGAVENKSLGTNQFVTGEVAIMTSSSSNVASILSKVGSSFRVGTAPFIRADQSSSYGATVSGSCLVMFDSGSSIRKEASWVFLKYLTGKEVQEKFAEATGYIPSSLSALEGDGYKALLERESVYAVAPAQLVATPKEMKSVTVGPAKDFYYGIMNGVSGMLSENRSPSETALSMEKELTALLEQYRRNNI